MKNHSRLQDKALRRKPLFFVFSLHPYPKIPMLRRVCKKCGEWFQPKTKFQRVCDNCNMQGKHIRKNEKKKIHN